MRKQYLSAPLPFVGQKRMFAREFIKVLKQYPEDTVFVDLFGGSGLLSHITKCQKPNATVIYNDFDGYRNRLQHIPQTNHLWQTCAKWWRRKAYPSTAASVVNCATAYSLVWSKRNERSGTLTSSPFLPD